MLRYFARAGLSTTASSRYFGYDGTRPELVVSSLPLQTCAVAAAKPECPSLFDNLMPDCQPVSIPSRRYSGPDAAFIESEVKRLYMGGIIRPSKSAWRAQPVVVTNQETGKWRLCVDYSQTINLYAVLDAYPLPRIEDMILKLAKYRVFSMFDLKSAYHQLNCVKVTSRSLRLRLGGGCGNIIACRSRSPMVSLHSKGQWMQ